MRFELTAMAAHHDMCNYACTSFLAYISLATDLPYRGMWSASWFTAFSCLLLIFTSTSSSSPFPPALQDNLAERRLC